MSDTKIECSHPAWSAPDSPTCALPVGHDGAHSWDTQRGVTWTFTACWVEHTPGRRCLEPSGHDGGDPERDRMADEVENALNAVFIYPNRHELASVTRRLTAAGFGDVAVLTAERDEALRKMAKIEVLVSEESSPVVRTALVRRALEETS